MQSKRGYTILELIIAMCMILIVGTMGLLLYAVIHFILKAW